MERITSRIVKKLSLPKSTSHKGENGRLLIIAGSKQYHGSLIYALKAASRIVDLVYVLTTRENQRLIRKLRRGTAEFITVHNSPSPPLKIRGGRGALFDCILIGPGMGVSKRTYKLVEAVLKSGIRVVLDADALNVLDKKLLGLLGPQHILTPHKGELDHLSSVSSTSPPTPPRAWGGGRRGAPYVKKFISRYPCTIVVKGKVDIVASLLPPLNLPPSHPTGLRLIMGEKGRRKPQKVLIKCNSTGNQGMTKGGTGDVLAGLIAGLFCKNDAYTSAAAGVYVNGLAGDELYKKVGPFYDAEDLVEQIPKTLWNIVKPKWIYEGRY